MGCCFSAGPGDFAPAAAASGERGTVTAHGMRGSTPWQGGSKCPQILLPQGWGPCTFSGEVLANLATGPLTVLPRREEPVSPSGPC